MQITEDPILVGRGSHCSLILDDDSVSSTHAEFIRRTGISYVKDLNSTNGTLINGVPINRESALNTGDTIQIGGTFLSYADGTLRVHPTQIPQTEISVRTRLADETLQLSSVTSSIPAPAQNPENAYVGRALSGWTNGLLWGSFALISALVISLVFTLVFFQRFTNSRNYYEYVDQWDRAEDFVALSYLLWALLAIAVFVLLIVWSFRAHKATDALRPGPRSWSRGWTVGAWFIPLANLILVPMVLAEIHKIATAPRDNSKVSTGWKTLSAPGSLILWFILYGLGSILLGVGQVLFVDSFATENSYRVGVILMLIGAALNGTASMLAISFINSVSIHLRPPELSN